MLQNSILEAVPQRLQQEKLRVSIKLWNQQILSGGGQSLVTLYLNSPKALELLAKPSLGKRAEGYIKQKIAIQGSAQDAIARLRSCSGMIRTERKRVPSARGGVFSAILAAATVLQSSPAMTYPTPSTACGLTGNSSIHVPILKNLMMISIKRRSKSLIISAASYACSHTSGARRWLWLGCANYAGG